MTGQTIMDWDSMPDLSSPVRCHGSEETLENSQRRSLGGRYDDRYAGLTGPFTSPQPQRLKRDETVDPGSKPHEANTSLASASDRHG